MRAILEYLCHRGAGLWWAPLLALAISATPGISLAQVPVTSGDATELHEAVMEVTVNTQSGTDMLVVLRGVGDELWLAQDDLTRLRFRDGYATRTVAGQQYGRLNDIAGIRITIDETRQLATVDAPPGAFGSTRVSAESASALRYTRASPGAFLNYQLSAQRISGQSNNGAFIELGLFSGMGVVTNTALYRDSSEQRSLLRLDTAFTRDFPERLQTLVVGDSISDPGSWGTAVRFGGLRWGRNFALRPDLVTLPTLVTSGTAVVPSAVDVFVNGQRVSHDDVPPGPFIIDRLPAVSGAGEMRVVVRDALGREQVLTQSFYSSTRLLARGLSQYSLSLGRVREDYTLASSHYGDWLGSASYRRGVGDWLTLEAHGEFLHDDARALGLNAAVSLQRFGVLNLTAAHGGNASDSGWLTGIGYERVGRGMNFLLSTTVASSGFHQIGDTTIAGTRFQQRDLLQVGFNLGAAGSLSLAAARQTYRTQPTLQTLSLSHSMVLRQRAALSLTLNRNLGDQPATNVFLSFTMAIGARRSATLSAVGGQGNAAQPNELYATVQQNPPVGPGGGYRLGVATSGNYDSDVRWNFPVGDIELQAARNQGLDGQSALWNGGATLLGGQLRAARAVTGSFAVVDVGGIADVPVYVDHQLVTHTDSHGRALLPNMRAYEPNRINIEPLELPLDTSIGARTMVLAPAFRSGVVARFPVVRERGAVFRLVDDNGHDVPAGAMVLFQQHSFPVALDGQAYITGYDAAAAGVARWGAHECYLQLPAPPANDPLPDLGIVPCHTPPATPLEGPAP